MDIDSINFADLTGRSFSVAEQCALNIARSTLLSKTKQQFFSIWGKVRGHATDYIVVFTHDDDILAPSTTYHFSTDGGVTFTLLPAPVADERAAARQQWYESIRGCFIGDPAFEYRVTDAVTGEEQRLLESGRLAALIAAHTDRCRIVPRGAFALRRVVPAASSKSLAEVKPSAGRGIGVLRNGTFDGLERSAAGRIESYVHLRPNTRPRASVELPEPGSAAERFDCLDPVSDDVPLGQWSFKYDALRDCVYGQSLWLDGAVFFHVPGTSQFGNVYIGDGTINHDLAFMVVG
jgi:radial spoke head protein 9